MRKTRRTIYPIIMATILAIGGLCAGCTAPRVAWDAETATELQWPPRPEAARVRWLRTITSEKDVGITPSLWRRTLAFITGAGGTRIVRPHGLLVDAHDRLLIADPGAGLVHCMDLGAGDYFTIGGAKTPLRSPIGLAVDDQQRLYITDSTQGAVFRFDLVARSLQPFLRGPLQRPTGIAWNPVNRRLYVVDTLASQVVVFDEEGHERQRIGASGEAGSDENETVRFNRPTDIWIDHAGQLYVTDPLNARIKIFTSEGRPLSQFGIHGDAPGELNKPKGVATDREGHIYIADALLDAVQIFAPDGTPLLAIGANGSADGGFWMPSGLFIDDADRIFVADTYNRRVQVFRYLPGAEPSVAAPTRTMP